MPLFEALRRKRAKMARVIPRNICLGLSDIEMHLLKILEFRSVAQKICLKDTLTTNTGRSKGMDCSISLPKFILFGEAKASNLLLSLFTREGFCED
jgi:hypothetical protein